MRQYIWSNMSIYIKEAMPYFIKIQFINIQLKIILHQWTFQHRERLRATLWLHMNLKHHIQDRIYLDCDILSTDTTNSGVLNK